MPFQNGVNTRDLSYLSFTSRFPRRLQRKPLVSNPGMHNGTCVTHVPWCMSGSLTLAGGETFPALTAHTQPGNFTYLIRSPWCWQYRCLAYNIKILINFFGYQCTQRWCSVSVKRAWRQHVRRGRFWPARVVMKTNWWRMICCLAQKVIYSAESVYEGCPWRK